MIYETHTPEQTERIGEELARKLYTGGTRRCFIALRGEMGVGKTAFVRGFCRALGVTGVRSPTYTVVNEYSGEVPVFHLDTYRITDGDDLFSVGYDDYLAREGYILCEWSENIEECLPPERITVSIARGTGETDRKIEVTGCTF